MISYVYGSDLTNLNAFASATWYEFEDSLGRLIMLMEEKES